MANGRRHLHLGAVAALLFFPQSGQAQGYTCAVGQERKQASIECDSGEGCWVFLFGTEEQGVKVNTGGCMRPSGREILSLPISGSFDNVPVTEAVSSLVRGTRLQVRIVGDAAKRVSLRYENRPLQLVLLDIERLGGVTLETTWLPRIKENEKVSFGANAPAAKIALLLYTIRGLPLDLPEEKAVKRVRLNLEGVTLEQIVRELRLAVQ